MLSSTLTFQRTLKHIFTELEDLVVLAILVSLRITLILSYLLIYLTKAAYDENNHAHSEKFEDILFLKHIFFVIFIF